MTRYVRAGAVIALLCAAALLCGCPPGAGGRQGQQSMPPGSQPPPGMDSGGAWTFMGTTITAPSDSFLLVKFPLHKEALTDPPPPEPKWQSCRRAMALEGYILIEGLNYDGRDESAEKDVNQLLPSYGLDYFLWKYEAKPAPPAEAKSEADKKGK